MPHYDRRKIITECCKNPTKKMSLQCSREAETTVISFGTGRRERFDNATFGDGAMLLWLMMLSSSRCKVARSAIFRRDARERN